MPAMKMSQVKKTGHAKRWWGHGGTGTPLFAAELIFSEWAGMCHPSADKFSWALRLLFNVFLSPEFHIL